MAGECLTDLVVNAESDELCEEGAREAGRHQEIVAQGTLQKTLAHQAAGKLVVVRGDSGRMVRVGVHLCED